MLKTSLLILLHAFLLQASAAEVPHRTPTKFVTQILEPTGGKITRPKNWHYAETHNQTGYMWTISREKSVTTPYTTGVRIQALIGVKANTGKSAQKFLENFIAQKQATSKVVKTCEDTQQAMFTRRCLEVTDNQFHVLYSFFWNNEMDIAVISIAGTTPELWDVYAPVFDKMSSFELINFDRFKE